MYFAPAVDNGNLLLMFLCSLEGCSNVKIHVSKRFHMEVAKIVTLLWNESWVYNSCVD